MHSFILPICISFPDQVQVESVYQSNPVCYNSGQRLNLSCSDRFIAIEGVKVGAKLNTINCSRTNCCAIDTASDCIFDYADILGYQQFCNGKHVCNPEPTSAVTVAHCENTYDIFSKYMFITFSCIDGKLL